MEMVYGWENRKKFKLCMADIIFEISHRYDYIKERCSDYIVDDDIPAEIIMEVSPEFFQQSLETWLASGEVAGEALEDIEPRVEFACVPVSAYYRLPEYDAVWLHATVVEYQGCAYAFTAQSGYGKTTHARLWLKAFGSEARIINGDNPILRMKDGTFYAYGTPFCGKEGYQVNTGVPLKGICYLTHSETNFIRRMEPSVALMQLFHDNKWKNTRFEEHLDLYTKLVEQVPVYQLYCNQEPDAACVAWEGMREGCV